MYKSLQEYNTSLQQYNSKLQSELNQTNKILKNVEQEKVAVSESLSNLRDYCTSLQDQLTATKVGIFITVHFKFLILINVPYIVIYMHLYLGK